MITTNPVSRRTKEFFELGTWFFNDYLSHPKMNVPFEGEGKDEIAGDVMPCFRWVYALLLAYTLPLHTCGYSQFSMHHLKCVMSISVNPRILFDYIPAPGSLADTRQ
jgi:hypothetical protein